MARQDPAPFYPDKSKLLIVIDAEGKEQPITTAADWPRRRAHILSNLQLVMGPMPPDERKVPPDVQVYDEVKHLRYLRKTISFASEAGDRVPAFLLIPHELKGRAAAMLCLHQTTALGKQEPAGMGLKNLAYAAELAERGMVTLAPDYPGYGDYKIDVYAKGYASATMKGIWNHRRAVDVLQSLPEADPARIGVIGHSLGGHNSLFVAAFEPRIKAVVTSCGFNAFPKYYGGKLNGWSHKGYMPRIASEYGADPKRMPFDFTEILGAIAPRALFINAPLHDANFEVSGVRDCVAAAAPVYELLGAKEALQAIYPDAAHDFPAEVRKQAYDFLEQALK
jgi:dienelactone hydrolase